MKTNNIILIVAVAIIPATVHLNAGAVGPLLSPHGRQQQVRVVPGEHNDPDLVAKDRDVTASPRALETFPWLAQTAARNRTGAADVATGQETSNLLGAADPSACCHEK